MSGILRRHSVTLVVEGYVELRAARLTFDGLESAFPRQRYKRLFLAGEIADGATESVT